MTLLKKRSVFYIKMQLGKKNSSKRLRGAMSLAKVAHVGTQEARVTGQSALPPGRVYQQGRTQEAAEKAKRAELRAKILIYFLRVCSHPLD